MPQVRQKNKDWVTDPEILPSFECVYFGGSSTWQVSALVFKPLLVCQPFTSYLLPCGFNNLNIGCRRQSVLKSWFSGFGRLLSRVSCRWLVSFATCRFPLVPRPWVHCLRCYVLQPSTLIIYHVYMVKSIGL